MGSAVAPAPSPGSGRVLPANQYSANKKLKLAQKLNVLLRAQWHQHRAQAVGGCYLPTSTPPTRSSSLRRSSTSFSELSGTSTEPRQLEGATCQPVLAAL